MRSLQSTVEQQTMTLLIALAKIILGPTTTKATSITTDQAREWYRERACLINALAIITALVFFTLLTGDLQ